MKHFPSIVVIACFIYNWLAANAYHPLAAMLANKKQSLRKTVSGILGTDNLKGYFSKHLSKLDMVRIFLLAAVIDSHSYHELMDTLT